MTDGAVSVPPAPEEQFPHVNPHVYRFVVDVTFLPVLLSGMRLDIHGREHVPPPGTPLVVAANHQSALDPFLTGREHLNLQAALHGISRSDRRKRGSALLERVGLQEAADRRVRGY